STTRVLNSHPVCRLSASAQRRQTAPPFNTGTTTDEMLRVIIENSGYYWLFVMLDWDTDPAIPAAVMSAVSKLMHRMTVYVPNTTRNGQSDEPTLNREPRMKIVSHHIRNGSH